MKISRKACLALAAALTVFCAGAAFAAPPGPASHYRDEGCHYAREGRHHGHAQGTYCNGCVDDWGCRGAAAHADHHA